MELKRILARDIRGATTKAVSLYGEDVLFVSNNRVNGMTEVIVATDLKDEIKTLPPKTPKDDKFEKLLDKSFRDLKNKSSTSNIEDSNNIIKENLIEKKSKDEESKNYQSERDYIRGREIVDMVRDELAALRKEIKLAQNISSWRNELPVRPEVKPLVNALSEASIPVSLRTLLVEHIRELDDLSRAKKNYTIT